jgi:hypothetical protein
MPLIYGSYLAGSLLTTLVPIALLICFATFFYRQARRQTTAAETKPKTPDTPVNRDQPPSHQ